MSLTKAQQEIVSRVQNGEVIRSGPWGNKLASRAFIGSEAVSMNTVRALVQRGLLVRIPTGTPRCAEYVLGSS